MSEKQTIHYWDCGDECCLKDTKDLTMIKNLNLINPLFFDDEQDLGDPTSLALYFSDDGSPWFRFRNEWWEAFKQFDNWKDCYYKIGCSLEYTILEDEDEDDSDPVYSGYGEIWVDAYIVDNQNFRAAVGGRIEVFSMKVDLSV